MKRNCVLLTGLLITAFTLQAQNRVDSIRFFTDEKAIDLTLTTDIRKLQTEKQEDVFQDAEVTLRFPDSSVINEKISVGARGHFRRDNCKIPPITLNFRNTLAPRLSSLGKLKLVIACDTKADDEQLIFKEFLVYKIYNLLEPRSFRVRLVKVNYIDTRNKMKPFSQYAFLVEDDADMAKRNDCMKKEKAQFSSESTDRELMTMVAVFEYMISNTDWSVPANHNIKLIYDKKNPGVLPYAVPYDFDHSGFVNAGYALPSEIIGTQSVTERVYRGFPRKMEELQATFDIFRAKRAAINALISNFTLLKERTRGESIQYLNEFYETINDRKKVQKIFIDNARDK